MQRFARPLISLAASLGIVGAVALGSALPVGATADTGVTITGGTLSGGGLTFNNTGAFTGVTLNGSQQTTTETLSIANITDARGTGAGWNDSLTLTQLKQYSAGAYVVGGYTLPTSSIKVTTAPVVSLVDSTSSAASTITPVATNTALDTGSAVKLLDAAANGGMGSYSFSNITMTLTIPANAYAATYKTDATVSLNAVP
jgi:hypothetical protein